MRYNLPVEVLYTMVPFVIVAGLFYFTAKDEGFETVVADWRARGLVHDWTDTFDVFDAGGRTTTSGPMRYATRDGLRSLGSRATKPSIAAEDTSSSVLFGRVAASTPRMTMMNGSGSTLCSPPSI